MKQKYHLKINQPEPSRTDIEKHMDFDALLAAYQAQPEEAPASARVRTMRSPRWAYQIAAAAAVLLLLGIGWQWLQQDRFELSPKDYFAQRPFIDPPLERLDLSANYMKATVGTKHGGQVALTPESQLQVPEQAFVDANGQLVSGEVEIFYRELHDFVDFFLSGVPLHYDSATQAYQLESAGMIEIYATHQGERVSLAPDRAIEVSFASYVYTQSNGVIPQLSIYQLDTTARNWQYIQPDQIAGGSPNNSDTPNAWEARYAALRRRADRAIAAQIAADPVPQPPIRPEQASGDRPTIDLNNFATELPLAAGSNVPSSELSTINPNGVWEIAPESPTIDPRAFQVEWEEIRLVKIAPNRYELTLLHSANSERLIVRPALLKNNYERAMAEYEQASEAYKIALAAHNARMAAVRDSINASLAKEYEQLGTEFAKELAAADNAADRRAMRQRRVQHRFTINELGIYTSAHPLGLPSVQVQANYQDASGNRIIGRTAYVTNARENTVYQFLAAKEAPLRLHPDTEHLIWVVTEDNQLVVGRTTSASLESQEEVTIELQDSPPEGISSKTALRKLLSF